MDQYPGRMLLEGTWRAKPHLPFPETSAETERLAASIERAVQQNTRGGIHNLRVTVEANEIVLFGQCTTYYLKQLAQHAAMSLAGQSVVQNFIEVR